MRIFFRVLAVVFYLFVFFFFIAEEYALAFIVLVIALLFTFLKRKSREERQAEKEERQAQEATRLEHARRHRLEVQEQNARLAREQAEREAAEKRAEWMRTHRFVENRFKVAGVTFKNDDGSSRQAILKLLCEGQNEGYASGEIELYEFEGTPAFRVMTDDGCIGNIKKEDIKKARKFYDNQVSAVNIEIDSFTAERKRIFRADVIFKMDQENPDHKWFFDEMQ